jgi:drug/metabolite transporter (DMT)-like permease
MAVSTSAPLIRYAAAPALAIAFWRNALALPVVGGFVAARHAREWRGLSRRERRLCAVAGGLLAAHFATWVPSLSYTSVASSVALVATQPVWAAVIARARGEAVPAGAWAGIGIALAGVVVLTGIDVSISGRALFGDLLALAGGVLAAAYVTVGAQVRRTVSTASYATACYAVAGLLLLAVCLAARLPLSGYSSGTWWALAALVVGPQLLGHTLINRVLRTISPTAVSVAILFEVVGATVLAWLWFGEVPPIAALPAALLVLGGVVLLIRSAAGAPALATPPVD